MSALEVVASTAPIGILSRVVLYVILRTVLDLLLVQPNFAVAMCTTNVARGHGRVEVSNFNALPVPHPFSVPLIKRPSFALCHQIVRHGVLRCGGNARERATYPQLVSLFGRISRCSE